MIPGDFTSNGWDSFTEKSIQLRQAQPLQEQQCNETEHRVMVQALPASPFEMIQPDFLPQFPVPQFTGPTLFGHLDEVLKCRSRQ